MQGMLQYVHQLSYFKIELFILHIYNLIYFFKIIFFLGYASQAALYFLRRCSIVFDYLNSASFEVSSLKMVYLSTALEGSWFVLLLFSFQDLVV